MKTWELLSRPGVWVQHSFARDQEGAFTDPRSPDARQWCAIGAIYKCYEQPSEQVARIAQTIPNLAQWNDHHTREEVVELLRSFDV